MTNFEPAANVILQRLQELQEWQRKQQEKLLLQQQQQREILTQEQKRLYEVFGLGTNCEYFNFNILCLWDFITTESS